ncbi:gamma-glutamylcyclotransferase [Roseobacter sp. HKCCA0434]|uniref:gamma-glutamylcyclotransferase n=1 Tax=Roseobacter sp. HKCCA0434 TaxID=3079297 RepID=UPI002905F734|nr:gamma-glutamylcyclotransferase [Roseobacter sp. HKCCA0434]
MAQGEFWVFGYGSLMWNPGFAYQERQVATLHGYRRSFCMHSIEHRGTPDRPGLVLALEEMAGASCRGVGFRVGPDHAEETLAYLRARELVTDAYLERHCPLTLDDGRQVEALTYVMDLEHAQYARDLSLDDQAAIIGRAVGGRGPNTDYLHATVAALDEQGIADEELAELARRVADQAGI